MSNVLTLLSIPHEQAAKVLLQDNLKPGVSVADLVIDDPAPGTGLEMTSRIFIAANAYNNPQWPYYGESDFTYHALELGDTFAGIPLKFKMPIQFTSMELALRLGTALGLHFDANDIFQETIILTALQSTYTLKAGLSSTRWKGSVDILIYSDTFIEVPNAD